jgi:hypothetical protein
MALTAGFASGLGLVRRLTGAEGAGSQVETKDAMVQIRVPCLALRRQRC